MENGLIYTDRLYLQPYRLPDAPLVHSLMTDTRVFFWREQPVPFSDAEMFVARNLVLRPRHLGWWGIWRKKTEDFLGQVGLQPLDDSGLIELGYQLAPKAWGHGFATEAATAVLANGFATAGLHKVMAIVLPDNDRSLAVIERLGFEHVGDYTKAKLPHLLFAKTNKALSAE